MKLYRLIVCAVFGMIALFAVAEGEYLHVKTANGVVVLDLSKVEKLSFTGGNLTATDSEAKVVARIPKSDLDKMYVSENADASSLNSVVSEDATATFVYESSSK